jgi:hypothetical protein
MLFYGAAKWGRPRLGDERLDLVSSFEGIAARVYRSKCGLAAQTENFSGFSQVELVSRLIGG